MGRGFEGSTEAQLYHSNLLVKSTFFSKPQTAAEKEQIGATLLMSYNCILHIIVNANGSTVKCVCYQRLLLIAVYSQQHFPNFTSGLTGPLLYHNLRACLLCSFLLGGKMSQRMALKLVTVSFR